MYRSGGSFRNGEGQYIYSLVVFSPTPTVVPSQGEGSKAGMISLSNITASRERSILAYNSANSHNNFSAKD